MRIMIGVSLVLGLAVAIGAIEKLPPQEKSSRKENAVLKTVGHGSDLIRLLELPAWGPPRSSIPPRAVAMLRVRGTRVIAIAVD